ncbi:MAG: hypothetical protein FJ077_11605, partial [Cyanobacteria bacterium K_DeepCast_35m_m2_023]|nr:hypothetical protein [Cyanobacteria bacterium K_DeepCast_35m_m2_023]
MAGHWVDYSGGGWNSHSILAAIVAGGLDGLSRAGLKADLNTLMGSVQGIGATSGGGGSSVTWLIRHL